MPWHELFRLERLTLDLKALLVSAELVGIEAPPNLRVILFHLN